MRTVQQKNHTVKFNDDQATKDKVFEAVIKFFTEQEVYNGESIMQCDAPQLEGPEFLATLADDIIKFEVEWDEE